MSKKKDPEITFTPKVDLPSIMAELLEKPKFETVSYFPESVFEINEGDPDWEPALSGKALYRRNSGDIDSSETIEFHGVNLPVDLKYRGDPSHCIYVYIPVDVEINYFPELGTDSFPVTFSKDIEELDVNSLGNFSELKKIPICKHMIVNNSHEDANSDLYDYPYTLLPVVSSCSSSDLGRSPKTVEPCAYVKEGTFDTCSAYEPFEPVLFGTVEGKEVLLSRDYVGYEMIHSYSYEGEVFRTYSEMMDYFNDKNLSFEQIWSPLGPKSPMFDSIVGRLEVTYPVAVSE